MTSGKEDYLKALYRLGEIHTTVTNKDLADELSISPPSVSEMIVKLQREGYIEYTAYRGSRLTELGRQEALKIMRVHRLWEVFLTERLGYSWSDAHEEAHRLEHHTSMKLARKLDEFLSHPSCCPHGSIIPDEDGTVQQRPDRLLSALCPGETSRICRVTEERELLDYLQALGICIGMEKQLKKAEPYEGPLILNTPQGELAISYKAACQIYVDDAAAVQQG